MTSQPENPPSPASSPEPEPTKTPKGLACIFCQQRKVKCDRQKPCASCTKSRVTCTYRARQVPRRRHNKATEVSLRARLARLEELLRTAVSRNEGGDHENIDIDEATPEEHASSQATDDIESPQLQWQFRNNLDLNEVPQASGKPPGTHMIPGQLVSDKGKSRYIENKLWNKIYSELKDTQDILEEESDDEEDLSTSMIDTSADPTQADMIFGTSASRSNLRALHPHPSHIPLLWNAFQENVNPLTKVLHNPSTKKLFQQVSQNLDAISRSVNALLFCVYLAAVTSLSEQECMNMLGEPKTTLFTRYKYAAQKALLAANYLKSSDLTVLQAFVIYLLAVRPFYDARTFWTICGLAVRIAQRIGIHKDGSTYGMQPFEVQMRRRLWWQIALIEVRASEVCGTGLPVAALGDIQQPLNINDEDIWPGMTEPPVEHEGTTEMCFVMLRSSLGKYFKHLYKPQISNDIDKGQLFTTASQTLIAHKMEEFETFLHKNFLKNADPLNPLQFFTSMVARAILCSWRVMASIRRFTKDEHEVHLPPFAGPFPTDPLIRADLFEESLKGIEYDNLGHTTKSTQRFLWHINSHFQWHSFIALLGELRTQTAGPLVDRAWAQVAEVYEHHPDFLITRNSLHTAVGNLTIAAWEAREAALARQYPSPFPEPAPHYVLALRRQRLARSRSVDKSNSGSPPTVSSNSPSTGTGMSTTTGSGHPSTSSTGNTTASSQQLFGAMTPQHGFGSVSGEPAFEMSSVEPYANFPFGNSGSNLGSGSLGAGMEQGQGGGGGGMVSGSGGGAQMDWNAWDSLLQNYELPAPMDGDGEFLFAQGGVQGQGGGQGGGKGDFGF